MAFWTDAAGLEPHRQFRWYIAFTQPDLTGLTYALKKCDKPKLKVNTIQHKYLNHFFNFPGRVEWEDINMTFASVDDPSMASALNTILSSGGYEYPAAATNRKTLDKLTYTGAVGTVKIIQINGTGATKETWELKNPMFTSVQYGSLDYSSEEIVEITCTMKYDAATKS